MKHIFVINPRAGLHSASEHIDALVAPLRQGGADVETYVTQSAGDARRYVSARAAACAGPMRFYACGGDGTLHEVINGVQGHTHAAVGAYPCGSGNDFVKYYGGKDRFLSLPAQAQQTTPPVDGIRTESTIVVEGEQPGPGLWRGIGEIAASGLAMRPEYVAFDAWKRFGLSLPQAVKNTACKCGDVLKGKITPPQCPVFGKACTPARPVGPCMVSSEGSCAAYYAYGGESL